MSVLAPAPARPIATTPAEIATEPATTVAVIVWVASAVMVSAPSASMAVPVADAVICAGVAVVASSAQPIRLRARDAPIARPAPTKPAPRAAETAPTVAVMVASSVAEIVTALLLDSEPPDAEATVAVRMTLATSAPAPLTPAPTSPPPTASDAAAAIAVIVAELSAVMVMPVTSSGSFGSSGCVAVTAVFCSWAETSLEIVLRAMVALTAMDTPTRPMPAARLAEPAIAMIAEWSAARSPTLAAVTVAAVTVAAEVAEMNAWTSEAIVFSAQTPAPLRPTPATAPAPIAADIATTRAAIVWPPTASRVSAPEAVTEVFRRKAPTSGSASASLTAVPMVLRATETPIEAPTPALVTATPMAAEAAAMTATTEEVEVASRSILAARVTVLASR